MSDERSPSFHKWHTFIQSMADSGFPVKPLTTREESFLKEAAALCHTYDTWSMDALTIVAAQRADLFGGSIDERKAICSYLERLEARGDIPVGSDGFLLKIVRDIRVGKHHGDAPTTSIESSEVLADFKGDLVVEIKRLSARGTTLYEGQEMGAADEGFREALDDVLDFLEVHEDAPTTSPSTTSSGSGS